ncbi:MAG: holo-ACP synthase [Thermodesulfovibrionia bacterium]
MRGDGPEIMIYGIGIDIVKIKRMRDAVERWGERFLRRIFTEHEIAYCYEKKEPYPSLAVRFAAKEAIIKALNSDVFIPLTDIEIINDKNGQPFVRANGRFKDILQRRSISRCFISLSHESEFGIALAVME